MKKGFTLIELMIVVVIIGLLAALAIPRFMRAAKKSKITERKLIVKAIWQAAMQYYESNGFYPTDHQFNEASTKNTDWVAFPELIVNRPSGYPRFSYYMLSEPSGGSFEGIFHYKWVAYAYAYAPDSWDRSMYMTNDLFINENGQMYELTTPYEPE
jgi:prepilin-type N-terminal cleavage/methylation domain-containing protein